MRRVALVAVLLLCGCKSAQVEIDTTTFFESLVTEIFHSACGESSKEREDRQRMESYRGTWSTPGRTDYEIETEARGTFERANGRAPNLNWSAR